jgi:hypothetical protein
LAVGRRKLDPNSLKKKPTYPNGPFKPFNLPAQFEFMKTPTLIALAALAGASIAGAQTPAQLQTQFKILTLPYTIAAPGTYVLLRNMDYMGPTNSTAISISATLRGPVVLDLKGFTIQVLGTIYPSPVCTGIQIGPNNESLMAPNPYPITIRNGTLQGFFRGISAYSSQLANYVGININHLTIQNGRSDNSDPLYFNPSVGIYFYGADLSSINNCTFRGYGGEGWGIVDNYSHGGNSYANDTFISIHPLEVIHPAYNSNGPVAVLNHMDWAPASK